MIQKKFFDHLGNPVILSNEIGRGGEGIVFNIQNNPTAVAKIYNKIPEPQKAEKISTMIRVGNERLLKLTTWPIGSIHTTDNRLIGFTMPKLTDHKPVYELYSPKIRLQQFPKADWRFLIHAAMNTARAFSVIHEAGHVIGDVNHGNLFVASDATVKLIDTDSFQVYFNNKYWFCEVGVPTHQPSEMQNKPSFKGIIRTPNHDNFGLAILIFQLLCLARHPFSGRYLGSGDMPIEKAIAEYRYAYAADISLTKMCPPPASLPMSALTPCLRLNFERAFSKEGEKLGYRPSPQEWITALTELSSKLKQCAVNQSHHFNQDIKSCPWCDIETKCKVSFFPIIGPIGDIDLDITFLWCQFLSIKLPTNIPPLPNIAKVSPTSDAMKIGKKVKVIRCLFAYGFLVIVSVLFYIASFLSNIIRSEVSSTFIGLIGLFSILTLAKLYHKQQKNLTGTIAQQLTIMKSQWDSLSRDHETLAKNYAFESYRNQICVLKSKYDETSNERERRFKELIESRFQQQLKQYLDCFRIDKANIEGIGQSRIASLQSYSIETAADIDSNLLILIPGFGPVLVTRLVDWRKACESGFVFDSKIGVSQSEVASLDQEIANKRKAVMSEMSVRISQLSNLSNEINSSCLRLQDQINDLLPKYAQAISDARAVGIKV